MCYAISGDLLYLYKVIMYDNCSDFVAHVSEVFHMAFFYHPIVVVYFFCRMYVLHVLLFKRSSYWFPVG